MWRRDDSKRPEVYEDGKISFFRREIPDLLNDPDFVEAINLWVDYKAFGNPFSEGFLDWPCQVYDILRCFDSLYVKYKINDN